jgi:hypothetical protein
MDILYYSNFCKHCQQILQFISKSNLVKELNCICIDKRTKDPKTGQTYILLENGKQVGLPPNIHSIPSLLLVKNNYQVLLGEDIIKHFEPKVRKNIQNFGMEVGAEPSGYVFNGSNDANVISEKYTYYNLSPEDLSTKGSSENREIHNYVRANVDVAPIYTPPDNYRPDKVSGDVTVDKLSQNRNNELPKLNANMW